MNENKVLRVEKKATNKVGLFILGIILLGGIGFGVYYYITNKDYISFDFSLPWKKKDDKDEKVKDAKGLRSNPEETIKREKTEFNIGKEIFTDETVVIRVSSVNYKEESYSINLTASNTSANTITIQINDILINGYSTRTNMESRIEPVSSSKIEFNISKETLDKYRINQIDKITLIGTKRINIEKPENITFYMVSKGGTSEEIKYIEKLFDVDSLTLYYYKTEESEDNYLINILFENNSRLEKTYYFNRFLVDDKEIDTSTYSKIIYPNSKYIEVIKIPKNKFRKIKKLTVSVITIQNEKLNNSPIKEIEL